MFETPEKKVAIATELLKDNVSTPDKFLRACHDAGITHGNRDTEDELWEFKEYVLRYVPGSIHAFRESLLSWLRAISITAPASRHCTGQMTPATASQYGR